MALIPKGYTAGYLGYTPPNFMPASGVIAGLATLAKLIAPPSLGLPAPPPATQRSTSKARAADAQSMTNVTGAAKPPTTTTPPPGGGGSTVTGGNEMAFDDTSGFVNPGGTTNAASVGGIPSTGTPYGGFASRYLPAEAYQAFDNPAVVLGPSLQGRGYSQSSPVYESLRNLQGADPLVLFAMMNAQGSLGQANDPGQYINWLNALYSGMVTPGGPAPSFQGMAQNIFNQPAGQGGDTLLAQLLNQGDANTQVSTLYNLMSDAGRLGLNPLASRALQGAMRRLGDQYATQVATGGIKDTPFYQFVKQQNPGMFGV